jgi:hypothetical protein
MRGFRWLTSTGYWRPIGPRSGAQAEAWLREGICRDEIGARLIEERAGHTLTEEARRARMRDLAKTLIARALEAHRRATQK